MKVKQLIEKLSSLDPELDVLSNGYEGGYKDIEIIVENEFIKNYYNVWYYGPHEIVNDIIGNIEGSRFKGVIIL